MDVNGEFYVAFLRAKISFYYQQHLKFFSLNVKMRTRFYKSIVLKGSNTRGKLEFGRSIIFFPCLNPHIRA